MMLVEQKFFTAIELTETEWSQLTLILQKSRPTNNAEVWAKSGTMDRIG